VPENLLPIHHEILDLLQNLEATYAHPVSSQELSKTLNVTPSYIRKQIQLLINSGQVNARRGIGGGYYLCKKNKKSLAN